MQYVHFLFQYQIWQILIVFIAEPSINSSPASAAYVRQWKA